MCGVDSIEIRSNSFCSVKTHIEPLAIAVNVAQATSTWCDHTMLILGNLYCIYTNLHICDHSSPDADNEDESHPVTRILKSIEK